MNQHNECPRNHDRERGYDEWFDRSYDWYDEVIEGKYDESKFIDEEMGGNYNRYNELMDEFLQLEEHNDDECIHKKYYVGSSWYYIDYGDYHKVDGEIGIRALTVNISTFYNIPTNFISNYICVWGRLCVRPPVEILQFISNGDGTYMPVTKTFWIKIIQRKWKKIMQEKKDYDKKLKKQIHSSSNVFQVMKNSYKGLCGMI